MKTLKGIYHETIYKERVSRSLPYLGRSESEQKESQHILSNTVVGIAGSGGIGGAMALRLARCGVRHIKIADPGDFDWSNVNRQLGASRDTIGQNKAEVVGHMVYDLAGDTTVDIFEEGITEDTADDFMDGCDLVLDKVDFSLIEEKYALHRAFRRSPRCRCLLACSVIGWDIHLYKFEKQACLLKNGMPLRIQKASRTLQQARKQNPF